MDHNRVLTITIGILAFLIIIDLNTIMALAFPVFPMRKAPHPIYAPQEVLVEFASWASFADIQKILDVFGIKEICKLHKRLPVFRVVLGLPIQVYEAVAILESFPLVKYAEPNFYVEAEFIPNDPIYIYQWHMGIINMELAWDIHNGAGAIVAVLDTGVAYQNALPYAQAPDLAGTTFLPGWDFVNDDAYPDDDNGHGTHIVGTIAQTTNNLYGCAGIAYGCAIMPLKVLDASSNGLLSDVISGIYFAVDNGAQLINTSFGTVTPSVALEDAVEYAALNGVSIVCSAGNGASTAPHYPSSYPECISVSAIKYDKTLTFYSNYGTDIDLCAPGGSLAYDQNLDGKPDGIVQQTHNGIDLQTFDFYIFQGTSCAAAHVTGVAALIIGASGGSLGPVQVKSILETTAQDLGTVGWDQYFGWGLVDAAAALSSLPIIATVASSLPLQPIPNIVPTNTYISFGNYTASSPPAPVPLITWPTPLRYFQNYNAWGLPGWGNQSSFHFTPYRFPEYISAWPPSGFIPRYNPSTFPQPNIGLFRQLPLTWSDDPIRLPSFVWIN